MRPGASAKQPGQPRPTDAAVLVPVGRHVLPAWLAGTPGPPRRPTCRSNLARPARSGVLPGRRWQLAT